MRRLLPSAVRLPFEDAGQAGVFPSRISALRREPHDGESSVHVDRPTEVVIPRQIIREEFLPQPDEHCHGRRAEIALGIGDLVLKTIGA